MSPRAAFAPRFRLPQPEVFVYHPGVGKPLFIPRSQSRILPTFPEPSLQDFIATDREGTNRITIHDVTPLPPGQYYDFLGSPDVEENRDYPIVRTFSGYRFPERLPEHWYTARPSGQQPADTLQTAASSDMSDAVRGREYGHNTKYSRQGPKAEVDWFEANDMYFTPRTTGGQSNVFVFYPSGSDTSIKFMAYFVDGQHHPDYTELFPRRRVTIHPNVAVEFIFARFAYVVINLFRPDVFDYVPDNEFVHQHAERGLAWEGTG